MANLHLEPSFGHFDVTAGALGTSGNLFQDLGEQSVDQGSNNWVAEKVVGLRLQRHYAASVFVVGG